ncbi:polysaccharide biosynthesis tyrosine autokinase [Sphingomonas aliaeris]|uniref:non-specific protein-tyrosine kinase n=1 Tax=Sphingomonas aliaeris TaxID=2759526 RepID=A0A974S5E0_9SPHN|nr:polysaccharide biosynthesis tyrosine autokinase [Sphingomonas aliaeris]QQV78474.1 polysaccharide biosynthesis tyrosine autokinase [Sphingomonas aliaeris]
MASIGPTAPTNLTVGREQSRDLALPSAGAGYGSYGSAKGGRELSLALIWRVLVEWRWLILAAIGVGVAGAVLVTLLTPLKYRSTATIELTPPEVEVISGEGSKGGRQTSAMRDTNFIGTQLGLLNSRALAERVAQDLNLASDPTIAGKSGDRTANTKVAANAVQNGTKVKLRPQSQLVDINFVARDPQLAARVVNGITDAYVSTNLERRYASSSYARDFLQRQIVNTRRDLEKSERELTAYAQKQGLITTGSTETGGDTNSLTGSTLVALNGALATTQAKRIAAEQRYREAVLGGATTEGSENAAPLRGQIAALDAEYQQKLQTFRPDYPDMVALRARIDALKSSVISETRTAKSDRVGTLRQEYQAAQGEENRLRAQVAGLSSSVLDQRGRRIQYTILQRDVDTNRSLYDALLQRYKEIGVASGIGTAVASVVDRGQVPGGAFSPNLYLNLIIGAALGLVAGILAAIALEFINDTIKTPDDVRDKMQLPFLGGIPNAKQAKPIEELKDTLSPVTEAYLSTATALQFVAEGGAPKTLLMTSTRPAEGKSTSAWALAQSFTRLGKTVLLIDADMRRPAFVTGKDEVGLSHILTNASSLSEHVLRTEVEGLWIMPAGTVPPSPPELIASARFASLLADAAATFDHVVIDGPPILGLADSPLLSTMVQATLMVVGSGRTRTRAVVEAQNRLRTAGAHVIGAILTRYQAQASYGYGYGYGYGQKNTEYRYVADSNDKKRRIMLNTSHEE